MKKILILIMVIVVICFSFCGCNSRSTNEGNDAIATDSPKPSEVMNNSSEAKEGVNFQNGSDVAENIFSNFDITMVNIWSTWCGYCVQEMPELQEVYGKAKNEGNVNLISICCDADSEKELAKEILKDNGCEFLTINPNNEFWKKYTNIEYYPTTIFVDSDGEIIGDNVVGAPRGDASEEYWKIIQERIQK